ITGTPQVPPVPVTSADSSPMATVERILGPVLDLLLKAALIVVMVVFMLVQREDLRNRVIRLSGEGSVTSMTKALDDAAHRMSRLLQMQLLINALYGLVMTVGMFIIGVPYPLVWGFLAGAMRYIPYVGVWISALLPLPLTAAIFPDWTQTLVL